MRRSLLTAALLLTIAPSTGGSAGAAVVVLANHAPSAVRVDLSTEDGGRRAAEIQPGESTPFWSAAPLTVTYAATSGPQSEALCADAVYRFVPGAGGRRSVQLRRVMLTGERPAPPTAAAWAAGVGKSNASIPVLLCVDEEEPMRERFWRERLRKRLEQASEIVAKHSGVRFEAAGYATWRSGNGVVLFERSLHEFENAVTPPGPALAIGFTSQYHVDRNRRRMGGTRGPLRRHILLREWSPQVSEPERVELLVHELGHFLGAAHSPEPTSVMRPVLGDRPVRRKDEVIRFDPINTLAIAMVGEEVRHRGVRDLARVTNARRNRLQHVYGTLAALTPGEPAAVEMLRRLAAGRPAEREVVTAGDRSEAAATQVVAAVTQAAAANRKRPLDERLAGDALTDALVRTGAGATDDPKGLLIGLGVALDDSGALHTHPRTRELANRVETEFYRRRRLNVLAGATIRDRPDTLKHFLVTAALVAVVGEKEASLWGLAKEAADAARPGGTGFSFPDMAANRAGIRFAKSVLAGAPPLAGLAQSFRCRNYVPELEGLEEGLKLDALVEKYGGQGAPRFDAEIAKIDERIDTLPAYALLRLGLPE